MKKKALKAVMAILAMAITAVIATTVGAIPGMENIVKIKTISQIRIPETYDVSGMFQGLKDAALRQNMQSAIISGSAEYEKQKDGTTRVIINWHTITAKNGENSEAGMLTSPLLSSFRVKGKRVTPGTNISAKGDLEQLAEDYMALKEKAEKPEGDEDQIEDENEEEEKDRDRDNSGMDPEGSDTGGNTSGGNNNSGGDGDTPATDKPTTTWEQCQPQIDIAAGKVYEMQKQVTKNSDGEITDEGACERKGATANIKKEFGGDCSLIVNLEQMKAFKRYTSYANLNGVRIDCENCTIDETAFYRLLTTQEGCDIRHDFDDGVSYQQEKIYYNTDTGLQVDVCDCRDSQKKYTHFLTDTTCKRIVDFENGIVIENKRVAFILDDGSTVYATKCRAQSGQIPIKEEFCDPKYEHDFETHQSYYRTRDFYMKNGQDKKYLNECSRSGSKAFPHIYRTQDCAITYDDENLQTIIRAKTWIETPTGEMIQIAPCLPKGGAIPYAFDGDEDFDLNYTTVGTHTWTAPTGTKRINLILVAGGCSGGRGGYRNGINPGVKGNGKNGGGVTGVGEMGTYSGGGGGGGGQVIVQTTNVEEGKEYTIKVGGSDQNSSFFEITAIAGEGGHGTAGIIYSSPQGRGGKGGAGYTGGPPGSAGSNGRSGPYAGRPGGTGGPGGLGYGAGGGGGGALGGAGGAGAQGYVKIYFTLKRYKRGDGTIAYHQP